MKNQPRLYLSIVGSHFAVDMFNSMLGVLLAVLAVPLALANTQIGLIITVYILVSSVTQPFFGWLVDRLPEQQRHWFTLTPLLLAGASVVWMAFFYALIPFAPSWLLLVVLAMLGALGSGLFHPIGTSNAPTTFVGSPNTATALFFLCGQMGLAMGPILSGLLIEQFGMVGVLPLAGLALVPASLLLVAVNDPHPSPLPSVAATTAPGSSAAPGSSIDWGSVLRGLLTLTMLAFVLLVALRSSVQTVLNFFLPTLMAERGWSPTVFGLMTGVFMGSGALGNVLVGKLVDRFGLRLVSFLTLLASVPASLVFLLSSSLPVILLASALSGVLVGGQHSVLVVHALRMLPVRKGLAAGLVMGFTFAAGATGTWVCGLVADYIGLTLTMELIALLALPAAFLALTLPGRTHAVAPVAQPQPARSSA